MYNFVIIEKTIFEGLLSGGSGTVCRMKCPSSSLKLYQLLGYSISASPTSHCPFKFIALANLVV